MSPWRHKNCLINKATLSFVEAKNYLFEIGLQAFMKSTIHDPTGFTVLHWTSNHCSAFTTGIWLDHKKASTNAEINAALLAAFMIFVSPLQSMAK